MTESVLGFTCVVGVRYWAQDGMFPLKRSSLLADVWVLRFGLRGIDQPHVSVHGPPLLGLSHTDRVTGIEPATSRLEILRSAS